MNKKLIKTRITRENTLEAMACSCTCPCSCSCYENCDKCSGGGSFQATERVNRLSNNLSRNLKTPNSASRTAATQKA